MRFIHAVVTGMLMAGMLAGIASSEASAERRLDVRQASDAGFVSPDACSVEPANIDEVAEILDNRSVTPVAEDVVLPLLLAEEVVTGENAEAVRSLLRAMLGCINAGDPARFLALFSDSFYQVFSGTVEGALHEIDLQATAEAGVGPLVEGFVLISESEVLRLNDGRLIYTVLTGWDSAEADLASVTPFEFVQIVAIEIDGTWLIDEVRTKQYDDSTQPPGCGSNCTGAADTIGLTERSYTGWIMPAALAESAAILFLNSTDELIAAFVPTKADVAEAETWLAYALRQHERATRAMIENLDIYQRQYFGLETEAGRLLVINAFCDPLGIDPVTTVVAVEDGGDCYWYVIYNLTTKQYETLHVNGES